MFFACGIWCLADVSSVSPSSEQTAAEGWMVFFWRKLGWIVVICPVVDRVSGGKTT